MHSRLKISEFERMILRFKLGSSQDTLPPQKVFTLGGISTLRGYKFKEFYGDQMALLNMEYWISGDRHSHLFWPLKFMQFGLFADFGSTHNLIFSDFDPQYYKMDVGFSFMDKDEDLRLDLARRTDSGDKPWVVTFRIAQFL
jgi:hemolysin activation/secretion protein